MWWVVVVIDLLLIFIAFCVCRFLYAKHFDDFFANTRISVIESYCVLHGDLFQLNEDFRDFSYNVLLKGVGALVCIYIVHFTDSLWIATLYFLWTIVTFLLYIKRCRIYQRETKEIKDVLQPVMSASVIPFVFQALFLFSLYLTFFMNV